MIYGDFDVNNVPCILSNVHGGVVTSAFIYKIGNYNQKFAE